MERFSRSKRKIHIRKADAVEYCPNTCKPSIDLALVDSYPRWILYEESTFSFCCRLEKNSRKCHALLTGKQHSLLLSRVIRLRNFKFARKNFGGEQGRDRHRSSHIKKVAPLPDVDVLFWDVPEIRQEYLCILCVV